MQSVSIKRGQIVDLSFFGSDRQVGQDSQEKSVTGQQTQGIFKDSIQKQLIDVENLNPNRQPALILSESRLTGVKEKIQQQPSVNQLVKKSSQGPSSLIISEPLSLIPPEGLQQPSFKKKKLKDYSDEEYAALSLEEQDQLLYEAGILDAPPSSVPIKPKLHVDSLTTSNQQIRRPPPPPGPQIRPPPPRAQELGIRKLRD